MIRRASRAAVLLAALAVLAILAATGADRAGAGQFYGLSVQQMLAEEDVELLRDANVEAVRIHVPWPRIERTKGSYDWSIFDEQVELAGAAGVALLPIVLGTPAWLESRTIRPPTMTRRGTRAWKRFLRRLVSRYGRRGTFVAGDPQRPAIKRWQIWNEPNLYGFWRPKPRPKAYARLLRKASTAIHRVDRRARIVLGGLPPAQRGIDPHDYLDELLSLPGIKRKFAFVAVHPYSLEMRGVFKQVRRLRKVLDRHRLKRKRLLVTEVGWGSEGYPYSPRQTPEGQARAVRKVFNRFEAKRRRWRLRGVYWFTWRDLTGDPGPCYFCPSAGLLDAERSRKPSFFAYRELAERG